jgi:hypothetical protein
MATLGSHGRRLVPCSRRLGRLKKRVSHQLHVCETDSFTVEVRVYGLADMDLGGLDSDEAYEARPLLKT